MIIFLAGTSFLREDYITWIIEASIIIEVGQIIDRILITCFVRQSPLFGAVDVRGDSQGWALALDVAAISVSNGSALQHLNCMIGDRPR